MEYTFWNLWENTKELQIAYKKEVVDKNQFIEYQLYEENIVIALRNIFTANLERENKNDIEKRAKNNILPIIGSRGSGKTTALSEFCRVLESISGNENSKNWWINHSIEKSCDRELIIKKKICFHVLKMIDASLMDESEDLPEVILYELFQEYKETIDRKLYKGSNTKEVREISEKFEALFQAYAFSRKKTGANFDGVLTYNFDYSMKNSFQIAQTINDLLDQLIFLYGENKEDTYFVIAIDDLDLNLSQGYQMLEQLQKFFSSQRIIILITIDYEQMQRVCVEHFSSEMRYLETKTGGDDLEDPAQHLSNDYMMKIFPIQKRLFMPDIRREMKNIGIILNDLQIITVKEFIMNKVADRMGIYYDIKGEKRHFCTPNSIRELVTYNDFMNSLNEIKLDEYKYGKEIEGLLEGTEKENEKHRNEKMMQAYDQNHYRFNWDITKRLAQITLNRNQIWIFTKLMDIELERRTAYFNTIDLKKNGDLSFAEPNEREKRSYCYGDLIERIYTWGRQNYENKAFISCVLASFTSEMVREYIGYCYFTKKDKKERCENRLNRFLGRGFSNEWIGEVVPYGFCNNIEQGKFEVRFDFSDIEKEIQTLYGDKKERSTRDRKKRIEEALRICFKREEFIKVLECIDMFCIDREENNKLSGIKVVISRANEKKSTEHGKLLVSLKRENNICFDALGLIIKSMNYQNSIDNLHRNIAKELDKYLRGINKEIAKTTIKLENIILSLLQEYSIMNIKGIESRDVAFPFYNLDMAYNILKRIKTNAPYVVEEKDNLIDNFVLLYDKIKEEMEREMIGYRFEGKREYDRIWETNPYYFELKRIVEQKDAKIYGKINYAVFAMCYKIPEPDLAN